MKYYYLLVTIKDYASFPAVFSYLVLYIFKYIENRIISNENSHLNDEDVANIYYILVAIVLILVYCKIIKIRFGGKNNRDKDQDKEDRDIWLFCGSSDEEI